MVSPSETPTTFPHGLGAGRYRRVQLPRGSVPAGRDSSVPRDGTTTRRAPGTTWTSRGVSPITSPSPWTGMGRSVWMATGAWLSSTGCSARRGAGRGRRSIPRSGNQATFEPEGCRPRCGRRPLARRTPTAARTCPERRCWPARPGGHAAARWPSAEIEKRCGWNPMSRVAQVQRYATMPSRRFCSTGVSRIMTASMPMPIWVK